jgi:hypothetical protein
MAKLNLKKVLEDLVEVKWLEDAEEKDKAFDLLKAISQDDSEEAIEFITKLYDSISEIVKGEDAVETVPETPPEVTPEETTEKAPEEKEEKEPKEELDEATVALKDDTVGKTSSKASVGQKVTIKLQDENGNIIEKTGIVKEVLDEATKKSDLEQVKEVIAIDEKCTPKKKMWKVVKEGVVVDMEQFEESMDKEAVKKKLSECGSEYDDVEEEMEEAESKEEPKEAEEELDEAKKPISLFIGHFGNGLSISDRNREEHGDYKKIAHIDPDRKITWYDEKLPDDIKKKIEDIAKNDDGTISATQDQKIFRTRPEKEVVKESLTESVSEKAARILDGDYESKMLSSNTMTHAANLL